MYGYRDHFVAAYFAARVIKTTDCTVRAYFVNVLCSECVPQWQQSRSVLSPFRRTLVLFLIVILIFLFKSNLAFVPVKPSLFYQECYMHCNDMKATHMALEFGFVCACGHGDESDYTSSEVGKCDNKCRGDASMMCGTSGKLGTSLLCAAEIILRCLCSVLIYFVPFLSRVDRLNARACPMHFDSV